VAGAVKNAYGERSAACLSSSVHLFHFSCLAKVVCPSIVFISYDETVAGAVKNAYGERSVSSTFDLVYQSILGDIRLSVLFYDCLELFSQLLIEVVMTSCERFHLPPRGNATSQRQRPPSVPRWRGISDSQTILKANSGLLKIQNVFYHKFCT
jgi:hypothetical protein